MISGKAILVSSTFEMVLAFFMNSGEINEINVPLDLCRKRDLQGANEVKLTQFNEDIAKHFGFFQPQEMPGSHFNLCT